MSSVSDSTKIGKYFGLDSPTLCVPARTKECDTIIKSSRAVGIEVEVENLVNFEGLRSTVWRTTEDGSLRNGGVEFVSKPTPANLVKLALNDLYTALKQNCSFSMRTSIHVHVNAQDMTRDQIKGLIALYTLCEQSLYRFIGRGRDRNIFCLPLYSSTILISGEANFDRNMRRWNKYFGFNILPLQQYGTVEFRHMAGTIKADQVEQWIDIVTRLVDFCANMDYTKFMQDLPTLSFSDFYEVVTSIFGKLSPLQFRESEFKEALKLVKASAPPSSASRLRYSMPQYEIHLTKYKGAFA